MNQSLTESPLPEPPDGSEKRRAIRPWLLVLTFTFALVSAWLLWPRGPEPSPYDLSRQDGRPRFDTTRYPKIETRKPANFTVSQRLLLAWNRLKQRRTKQNPIAYPFAARPVEPCSIHALLNQCMEVSGTQYLIAVEIAGGVDFGHTNVLNGAQWVAAVEHALETSKPVVCYDFAKKRNFEDGLLLIHDTPGQVKVVPKTKLPDYQKAGLVKTGPR